MNNILIILLSFIGFNLIGLIFYILMAHHWGIFIFSNIGFIMVCFSLLESKYNREDEWEE